MEENQETNRINQPSYLIIARFFHALKLLAHHTKANTFSIKLNM
jgi:hypothetical protein